jgi:hypothetical protein
MHSRQLGHLQARGSAISFFIVILFATIFGLPSHISAQTDLLMASAGNKFNFNQSVGRSSWLIQPDSTKTDSLSEFDSFNKKMENLFIYIPVPLYSYSTEAGHTFGLAKFNVINLYKKDTITKASKI